MSSSGSASRTMPCAAATALPSSTSPLTSRRSAGSSQTRPCVSPVSAPTGFVAALKITLRHCAGPRVGDRGGRHAGSRAGLGETLDRLERRRLRLERAEGGVALDVPLHVTRLEQLAGREGRAADHALDMLGDRLLVADPVLDGRDRAVRRRRARSPRPPHRYASPWWRRCRRRRAAARRHRPSRAAGRALPRAGEPQPVRVDRVHVRAVEVVRPHLDVVERGEVRGEQRADCATADDADPHAAPPAGRICAWTGAATRARP